MEEYLIIAEGSGSFEKLVDVKLLVVLGPFADLPLEVVAVLCDKSISLFVLLVPNQRTEAKFQEEVTAEVLYPRGHPLLLLVVFV